MENASKEQWQQYNPLDKRHQEITFDKSNKFPYCKPEKATSVQSMLLPKKSSIGVIPIRKTSQVDEMGVMVIGKSTLELKESDSSEVDDKKKFTIDDALQDIQEEKKKRKKMPAIVSSVGTTGKIAFSERKKPKPTPMTKLKGRSVAKPSLVPAPPNSRTSKRTSSLRSSHVVSVSTFTDKPPEAPPSSPSDKQEIEFVVSDTRESTSARSVDDIIKSLRTSREGTEVKSSSDIRIDELLKQVLDHSEEWSSKDEKVMKPVDEEETEILESSVGITARKSVSDDEEEYVDVSDDVSTLASQISAPAGIPDVAAILLRRSSEAQRGAGDSDYSGLSSPLLGVGDSDEYVDAAQAFKDLHQTLDVKNEDILCIKGQAPPVAKYETTSEDEGYYEAMMSSRSGSDRFQPADLTSTVTTGGRIHHLCLLAANSSTHFDISSSDAALSRLMHTAGNRRNALKTLENSTQATMSGFPPAPPPSQIPLSTADEVSFMDESQVDGISKLPPVLDEVEEYNKNSLLHGTDHFDFQSDVEDDKNVDKENSNIQLDTSKIDPLDIDAWRRLADNTIESNDMTQQGERCIGRESNMWRLIWEPAPPKMLIPPVAVKAALFPHYHGAQLTAATADGMRTEFDSDESESEDDEESENKKHGFNLEYLYRRHKSEEDLREISKQRSSLHVEEEETLQRSNSEPDILCRDFPQSGQTFTKMKTDYSTAMEELRQQRIQAMEKEQEAVQFASPTVPVTSEKKLRRELQTSVTVADAKPQKSTRFTEPTPPEEKISEAELSRQGGQQYVPYRRKSRRKSIKKNIVLIEKVRRTLSSYVPVPLTRSRSFDGSLEGKHKEMYQPRTRRSYHQVPLNKNLSRSIPKELNFQEFIDHYDNPQIDDMREWVRDIWNEWFDEVIPPVSSTCSDSDSWSTSSSEFEETEAAAGDVNAGASNIHPSSGSSAGKPNVPTNIPDVLQPVVVLSGGPVEDGYGYIDEDATVEVMKDEVEKMTSRIDALQESETSTKAVLLSRRGALNRKLGQIKLAKDDLNKALELEPRLSAAYWDRHLIKLLENKSHEALDDLNVLLKLDKLHVHGYRSRADIFAYFGDFTMAIVNYSQAIKLNPNDEDAYFQRAQLYEKKGDMLLALEDYGSVVKLNPSRTDALLKRGKFHFNHGNWHSTIADFTLMIQREPHNALARTYRGRAYAAMKQYESALADLSAAIHLDPLNWRAFYHRGCLLRTIAPEKSLQDFSCSLLINDSYDNAMALLHRGILYTELKRYMEAVVDFEECLRLDHGLACAHVNIGLVHHQITRNYSAAIRNFTNAINVDPTYVRAYMCRADSYEQVREHKKALHDVTRAIVLRPDDRHLYLRRGQLLLQLGELKLAGFCVRHIATLGEGIVSTSATQQAVVQSFLKNHDVAIESLTAACRVKPVPHMYVLLGKTLMKAKKFKMDHSKGVQDLNRALALNPTLFEAYLSRAAFYGSKGRHSKAILNCNEALRLRPNSIRAYLYRGALKFHIRSYKLAVLDLTCAIKLDRTCALAYFNRATCFQRMKKYKEALKDYSIVLMLCESRPQTNERDNKQKKKSSAIPLRLRVCVNRGLLYLKNLDDAHNAALDFEAVTEMEPHNIRVLHTMALCYHKLKLLNEAVESYTRCISVDPYFLAGYIGRGDASADASNVLASRYDYQRALKLDPTCVPARINLGYSLQSIGKLHQAWLQFTRAIELDPKSQQALEGRAVTCLRAGNIDAAFQDITVAFRAGNPTARLHAARGVVHQYMGDVKSAMADYQRAIKLDSSYSVAFFNAAALYLRDRRFREALAYLDHAVQLIPDDDAALTNRGIARVLLNDTEHALNDFNEAITANNKNAHTYYNRGNLLTMLKRYEEAEIDYTTAFTVDPSDYGALKKRADVRGKLGKKEQAVQDYKNALKLYERKKFLA